MEDPAKGEAQVGEGDLVGVDAAQDIVWVVPDEGLEQLEVGQEVGVLRAEHRLDVPARIPPAAAREADGGWLAALGEELVGRQHRVAVAHDPVPLAHREPLKELDERRDLSAEVLGRPGLSPTESRKHECLRDAHGKEEGSCEVESGSDRSGHTGG